VIFKNINKEKIDLWINYLIVVLGLTLPISVAANNIVLGLIFILWLLAGNYRERWEIIRKNRAAIAILLFFSFQIVALLYSSDVKEGLKILGKERLLLVMPLILSVIRRDFIPKAFSAFLFSMFVSEIISYGLYFGIYDTLPWRHDSSRHDIVPFMSHISYTPMLAFSVILLLHRLLEEQTAKPIKMLYSLFILTMSFNIFISGGRAGQIGFIVSILFYIGYRYRQEIKKMTLFMTLILTSVALLYLFNPSFHNRISLAYHNALKFQRNPNTSVGLRINFAINSLELIKRRPIFGYGTGSFPSEYKCINKQLSPNFISTVQPHNFYLLTLVQFGVIGLILLLYIFYSFWMVALEIDDKHKSIRYTFLILFMIIMLSDSYLLGHHTTLFFVFVSSLLFKEKIENV